MLNKFLHMKSDKSISIQTFLVFSYIAILALCIMLFLLPTISTANILKQQADERNIGEAARYRENAEANMELFSSLTSGLFVESSLENIAYDRSDNIQDDYYAVIQKIKSLNNLYANHFTQIFIYDHNGGAILYKNGKTNDQLFYKNILLGVQNISEAQYETILCKSANPQMLIVDDPSKIPFMYYSFTFGYNYQNDQYITAVFQSTLEDMFGIPENTENIYGIYSKSAVLCNKPEFANFIKNTADGLLFDTVGEDISSEKINYSGYDQIYMTMAGDGDIFFFLMPNDKYNESISNYSYILIFAVSIFTLLTGFLIYYFVTRQYKPIKILAYSIDSDGGGNTASSFREYEIIRTYLQGVKLNFEEYKKAVSRSDGIPKALFLIDLVRNSKIEETAELAEALKLFGINFPSQFFTVIIADILSCNGIPIKEKKDAADESADVAKYLVSKILSDILCNYFYAEVFQIEESVVCILSERAAGSSDTETLRQTLTLASDCLVGEFSISCDFFVGDTHFGLKNICHSYYQALKCNEYTHITNDENVIFYSEMINRSYTYDTVFSIESEHKLIFFLKSGNMPKAAEVLDELFADIDSKESIHPSFIKIVYLNILYSFVKVLESIDTSEAKQSISQLIPTLTNDMNQKNAAEMPAVFKEWIKVICLHVENARARSDELLVMKINDFVQQNFSKCNLCVSSIAEEFGINMTSLSTLYSRITGMGLHKYINKTRIEAATDFISTSGLTLEKIAEKSGFSNVRTFNRAFSAEIGTSPGQYRKQHTNRDGIGE